MAVLRSNGWNWPVGFTVALLLHGVAAYCWLITTELQQVSAGSGGSGVVISLASAPLTQTRLPASSESLAEPHTDTADTPETQLVPELPATAAMAENLPQMTVGELTAPPMPDASEVPIASPGVAPPVPTANPVETSPGLPIAKTYAIPADELEAMQAAERRRLREAENQQRRQARLREQLRRRSADARRPRATERTTRQPTTVQPTNPMIPTPSGDSPQAEEAAAAKSGETNDFIDSGDVESPGRGPGTIATASGSGSGETPDCRDDSDIASDSDKAGYKTTLQRYLQARQKYPRRAVQRRQQGCVVAAVSINRQGRVIAVRLIRKSGHRLLDDAAVRLVKTGKKLPPPPASLTNLSFKIPFDYRLN